jgi:DNA-binding winged helix-turn-helix (wHTH) protein
MASGPLIGPPAAEHNRSARPARRPGSWLISDVTYTFGPICVDGDARRVTRTGSPVRLTRKAFDLLLLLLDHQPNAVSKEQIHARVWPDTFVSDGSVQSLVAEIRRTIDDQTATASWIATVHGIGYRFDGPAVGPRPRPGPTSPERTAGWLIGTSIRIPLMPGPNIVGRDVDGDADIDAPTMSRQHARITIGEVVTIEDLDSKNGTWLDDERVAGPRVLADGGRVRLGAVTLVFRVARQPKPTEPAP